MAKNLETLKNEAGFYNEIYDYILGAYDQYLYISGNSDEEGDDPKEFFKSPPNIFYEMDSLSSKFVKDAVNDIINYIKNLSFAYKTNTLANFYNNHISLIANAVAIGMTINYDINEIKEFTNKYRNYEYIENEFYNVTHGAIEAHALFKSSTQGMDYNEYQTKVNLDNITSLYIERISIARYSKQKFSIFNNNDINEKEFLTYYNSLNKMGMSSDELNTYINFEKNRLELDKKQADENILIKKMTTPKS